MSANMSRRDFLRQAGAAVGAAACLLGTRAAEADEDQDALPVNVLVIMSDEHNPRYSSISRCPDYPDLIHTPNMAALAKRGVIFESCYCPSPLCMPSRSSFMAGLRNHKLQAYSNCSVYQDRYNNPEHPEWDFPTYGGVLAEAGVHTAYIGKVDVYAHSSRLGFSEMMLPVDRPPPGDCNIRRNPLKIRTGAHAIATSYGPDSRAYMGDEKRTARAVEWIGSTGRKLNAQGKAWSLTVNLTSPHFPHRCSPEDWERYADADLPIHTRDTASGHHPFAVDHRRHFEEDHPDWTPENVRGNRRGYFGKVTFVDRKLGEMMNALAEAGLEGNTVVAYTSDHGEMLGKFGMWRKCHLYEDSALVPLIAAGPGFARGRRVRTPVDLLDLQASVFKALGRERDRPSEWVGTPLQEIKIDDSDRVVFAEYHGHGARASHYMVRKANWKLIYYINAPHQLFDLRKDPNELTNLIEKYPDKARELEKDLRRICSPEEENTRAEEFIRRQLEDIERGRIQELVTTAPYRDH